MMKILAGDFKRKTAHVKSKKFVFEGLFSKDSVLFADIESIDVEAQDSQTSGGLGTAAAGGLLFGGAGAVVGAIVGRGARKEVTASIRFFDGRRILATFSPDEMNIIRAALFDVQDLTVEERREKRAAAVAKSKERQDVVNEWVGKIGASFLIAGLIYFLVT
ncbi:hypothetical protein CSC67_08705 [Pusillimonas caeni]|uniref:hypothetical protein n=1 Tax=Pusillimonas caeni TaxID=1348472 RepID=UPI000E59BF47|nr:hypothetical protein [Pusillimonas caeni]TFL14222.1 hypothetical protein CSC67_08705 [Pusillimonas caeni]